MTNLFDFTAQPQTQVQPNLDKEKVQRFIDRGKAQKKSKEEIRVAYDKGVAQGAFDLAEEKPDVSIAGRLKGFQEAIDISPVKGLIGAAKALIPGGEGIEEERVSRIQQRGVEMQKRGVEEFKRTTGEYPTLPIPATPTEAFGIAAELGARPTAATEELFAQTFSPQQKEIAGKAFGFIVNGLKSALEFGAEKLSETKAAQFIDRTFEGQFGEETWGQIKEQYPAILGQVTVDALSGVEGATSLGLVAGGLKPLAKVGKIAIEKAPKITALIPKREVVVGTKAVQEAQSKAFKSLNPTISKLTKDRNIGALKAKANRANEIIVERGFKPVDTQTRVDFHQKAMKSTWGDLDNKLKAAGVDTKIDFDEVGTSIKKYLDDNPALKDLSPNDYDKLTKLIQSYTKLGKKDVIFAENAKQIINSQIKNWGEGEKLSAAVSNGLKKATASIGKQLDIKLSQIPGEFQALKKDYGSLAETLEDAIKANVVNMRRKGMGLAESYSRIEGLSDMAEGLFSIMGAPKEVLPKIIKGTTKLVIGKKLQQLRDPDILVKDAFEVLSKTPVAKPAAQKVAPKLLKTPAKDFVPSAKEIGVQPIILQKAGALEKAEKALTKKVGKKPAPKKEVKPKAPKKTVVSEKLFKKTNPIPKEDLRITPMGDFVKKGKELKFTAKEGADVLDTLKAESKTADELIAKLGAKGPLREDVRSKLINIVGTGKKGGWHAAVIDFFNGKTKAIDEFKKGFVLKKVTK